MYFRNVALAVTCLAIADAPLAQGSGPPGGQAASVPASFTAEQVKSATEAHVQEKLREGHGVYRLADADRGETLALEFVDIAIVADEALWQIHDPRHQVVGRGYVACTSFRAAEGPREKLYDIDMWLLPSEGKLQVVEVRVHKEPRLVNGKWVKEARFTRTRKPGS